jgi:hypothetical protein
MTTKQLVYLLLVGVCAAGGQFGITAAYYLCAKQRNIDL